MLVLVTSNRSVGLFCRGSGLCLRGMAEMLPRSVTFRLSTAAVERPRCFQVIKSVIVRDRLSLRYH